MKGRYWTAAQRAALERELDQTDHVTHFRRLLALLEIDQGKSVAQVARPLNWNKDMESLLESALAQPPLEMGYPANGWTLPLLQAFLPVYLPEQSCDICGRLSRLFCSDGDQQPALGGVRQAFG